MYDITLLDAPLDAPPLGNPSNSPKFICVCCNCDRVRLLSGAWVDEQTPLNGERRTHGLCPECFVSLYPEFAGQGGGNG